MKILMLHNRYLISGGEDKSCEAEKSLLIDKGHQVQIYQEDNRRVTDLGKLRVALKTIWSRETYQTIRTLLRENPYDLVHVQNFFPLISPSAYYAAKSEGVPVIQSLRNYRLFCSNSYFFRHGKVCEDCLNKSISWPGIVHACYRESHAGTAVVTAMQSVHRLLGTWENMVDRYIVLTEFSRQKFIEGGLPAEKIVVKPNFVYSDPGVGEGKGGYALFVGRLSPEKGIETMLRAWKQLGKRIPLKIVGNGPLSERVSEAAKQIPEIEWLGVQPLEKVYQFMGEAMFLIFPSEWYETFGRVAIEAFATGTPVIASKIGAIAELVEPGRTGLLFHPGDALDLTKQVDLLLSNKKRLVEMRKEARSEFEAKYTAERNYQLLINIYDQVSSF